MSPSKAQSSRRWTWSVRLALIAVVQAALCVFAAAQPVNLVVSVPEQKMYVFNEAGERLASYRISTSARGLGDSRGSYATPLGRLAVAEKIGAGAPVGSVFKGGRRTGEICHPNTKGRDPIITRILHLRGLESQNAHAYGRCIYIHGTPEEGRLGKPVSYGCIRMRSADVVQLFDMVEVGTQIEITQEKVTGMFGIVARRPVRVGATASATAATASPAPQSGVSATAKAGTERSGSLVALSAKRTERAGDVTVGRGSGSHMKLLETSGLTINFGGAGMSEGSDRPR